ncbi:MAG: inositol monophosphatase family protein [Chloroflexota bacterium]
MATDAETASTASSASTAAGSQGPRADLASDLRFASDVAATAGELLIARYERVERVDHKSARDVVTEVDHLSEELILGEIRRRYPDDAILAEESGEHHAVKGEEATIARGRTWVVDPLDGTVNYANGIPFFCVSIALVIDGRPAVGVVLDPSRGECFAASRDTAATRNGERVEVSDKEKLSDFVVSLALGGRAAPSRTRAVRKAIRISRSMGSAALGLAYVANGRFDAFVQSAGLSAWDIAAAGLIAERGGATVTDMSGATWFDVTRPTRTIGILAAPPQHHPELLRLAAG